MDEVSNLNGKRIRKNPERFMSNNCTAEQLAEHMMILKKVRRLVVAVSVSPVTTSSPFLARESLLIGDSAKQLDIKTPYQRGVLNTQHRSESSQSDISRGSPVLTPTSQSSSRPAGHIDRVGLQTANYLDFSLKNKQEVLSSSQTWSSQMVR